MIHPHDSRAGVEEQESFQNKTQEESVHSDSEKNYEEKRT